MGQSSIFNSTAWRRRAPCRVSACLRLLSKVDSEAPGFGWQLYRPNQKLALQARRGTHLAHEYRRPPTPADVERKLRQEAGFGCARCGHPYIEYHHIIPYAEEPHFRAEDMIALCGNCHSAVSKLGRDRQYVSVAGLSLLEPSRFSLELQLLRVVANDPYLGVIEARRSFCFDFKGDLHLRTGCSLQFQDHGVEPLSTKSKDFIGRTMSISTEP